MRKVIIVFGMAYLIGCTPTNETTDRVKSMAEPPSYNLQADTRSSSSFKKNAKKILPLGIKYCSSTKALSKVSKYCNFALGITK